MTRFASRILEWYARHGRDLPWRRRRDPYAIWISEVMLQQTRVEAVLPYYERWMARIPSVRALAEASEHTVLKQWEGLGYYSRPRSLRRAAQIIVHEHHGKIPEDVGALRRLPGVGAYTAGAVASIAFGMDEPAVDANIRRVLARVFDARMAVGSSDGERLLRDLASQNLPKGRAADFNQALMDLGAVVCLPKSPHCTSCPVRDLCKARKTGRQSQLPVRAKKPRLRRITLNALVISRQGRVLLRRRPSRGLLGGMWEFPKGEIRGRDQSGSRIRWQLLAVTRALPKLKVENPKPLIEVRHAYSHVEVLVRAYHCRTRSSAIPPGYRWASSSRLSRYPMGKIDRRIADSLRLVHRYADHGSGSRVQTGR